MPELPELEIYAEALRRLLVGRTVRGVHVKSVFTVRTVDPTLESLGGRSVTGTGRRGKRLSISLGDVHLLFHLKLSGRLRWRSLREKLHGRIGCLKIDFDHGSLHMTEASSEKSASVHVLRELPPEPVDPLESGVARLREILSLQNRQLKGALTDPALVGGIGNAYSDEILFAARLSPLKLTHKLVDEEWARLGEAVPRVLREWIVRVREAARDDLPTEQGAWRKAMSVHGKFKSPCPVCGTRIERIAYEGSETHYCPGCQTGGKKLSDRRLDRLFR